MSSRGEGYLPGWSEKVAKFLKVPTTVQEYCLLWHLSQHYYRWICWYLFTYSQLILTMCIVVYIFFLPYLAHFQTYNETQTFPDNACRREILNLDVYCTHVASGCGWIGKLKELDVSSDVKYSDQAKQSMGGSQAYVHIQTGI